jgi:chemotaxis protein MotA
MATQSPRADLPSAARIEAPQLQLRARGTLDAATILGLGGGFLLIGIAITLGGSLGAFIDPASILIVLGGTFAATTVCFSLREILRAQGTVFKAIFRIARNPTRAATQMLQLSEYARHNGILALEKLLPQLAREPILHRAVRMVVDGIPAEEVEALMRQELAARLKRHAVSVSILRKSSEISPAMGLIGTLIGLVQMLGNLNNPSSIGPNMAVALLTTFYGAVLANLVFMPLAAKLERNSNEESLIDQIYVIGAVSMGRQENPRRLEMSLNTALPPAQRVRYFD